MVLMINFNKYCTILVIILIGCFTLLSDASAKTLSQTECDVGYLEVEGASPSLNKEWVPQVGVDFMKSNGAKSRSVGFVPGTKTKFTVYVKKPGERKFKKARKISHRYKGDTRYRGTYLSINKKYFQKKGQYSIKAVVEGNKLPTGRLTCSTVFDVNVQ